MSIRGSLWGGIDADALGWATAAGGTGEPAEDADTCGVSARVADGGRKATGMATGTAVVTGAGCVKLSASQAGGDGPRAEPAASCLDKVGAIFATFAAASFARRAALSRSPASAWAASAAAATAAAARFLAAAASLSTVGTLKAFAVVDTAGGAADTTEPRRDEAWEDAAELRPEAEREFPVAALAGSCA